MNLSVKTWHEQVPSLDVWLKVENSEVHYVSHIIPTLEWTGSMLGVRLIFEPKNTEELYKAYKLAYETAMKTIELRKDSELLKLWPQSIRNFLDKELHKYFCIKAYILDPSKFTSASPKPSQRTLIQLTETLLMVCLR